VFGPASWGGAHGGGGAFFDDGWFIDISAFIYMAPIWIVV